MSEEYCPSCESLMIKTETDYSQRLEDKLLFIDNVEAFICTNAQCEKRYITDKGYDVIDRAYKKFFLKPRQILKIERKITTIGKDHLAVYLPPDIIRSYNSVNGIKIDKNTNVKFWIEEAKIVMEPVQTS